MVSSQTSRSEVASICSKRIAVILVTFALCACGSLEETVAGRNGSDDGGTETANGASGSSSIDSGIPPTVLDGGRTDGQAVASDANTADSGTTGDAGHTAADSGAHPFESMQRVVFVHMGHGFGRRSNFTPAGTRDDPQLVNALAPLAPFIDRTLVIDGINANPFPLNPDLDPNRPCRSSVSHGCPQSLLSGMYRGPSATQPRTIDHRVAEWLGPGAREFLSVVATTSQEASFVSPSRWITTYDGAERNIPAVTDPAAYLDSLTSPRLPPPSAEAAALLSTLEVELPNVDTPEERVGFFARAIAAKIAFGAARVATWNLAHLHLVLNGVVDLGSRNPNDAVTVDHLGNATGNSDAILTLKRWCIEQLAELATRLNHIPEGSGTALDHTLIVFYADSLNIHGEGNAPAIVIGGGAPSLRMGEYVSVSDGFPSRGGRMIDVMATIVSALGMSIDGIGPPDEPARILAELLR